MRIRTIKPEFWVSESIGRLSRDARLLFIGLWSFADDSGRGRGAFPAISGALFPYDSDAISMLPAWFKELEDEGMVRRYQAADGNTYYEIPKWFTHQKIDKPSKSKFPPFSSDSPNTPRILPEISALEQGTGNREQGPMEQGPMEQEKNPPIVPQGDDAASSPTAIDQAPKQPRWRSKAEDAKVVLDYLNQRASRSFRPVDVTVQKIASRLIEPGVTVEGCKRMIDRMVAMWGTDERMSEYLRPETLFGAQKFQSYYDNRELPVAKPASKPAKKAFKPVYLP